MRIIKLRTPSGRTGARLRHAIVSAYAGLAAGEIRVHTVEGIPVRGHHEVVVGTRTVIEHDPDAVVALVQVGDRLVGPRRLAFHQFGREPATVQASGGRQARNTATDHEDSLHVNHGHPTDPPSALHLT